MVKKIKGTVIIYLRSNCKLCEIIKANKDKIRELYRNYFENLIIKNAEDNQEFISYGFQYVPTLILPGYRPFEAIDPKILMSEDYLIQMINGDILPDDVVHIKELERRQSYMMG